MLICGAGKSRRVKSVCSGMVYAVWRCVTLVEKLDLGKGKRLSSKPGKEEEK
jgi:hypothetical protein